MVPERFKLYLVSAIFLIGAPFLGAAVANGDLIWIAAPIGIAALFLLLFGPTEYVWTLLVFGVVADFRPNFLKFNISFGELATAVLFGNLIVKNTIFERKKIEIGPLLFWVPIIIIAAIMLVHTLKSGGGFGLKVLGSGEYGARRHLSFFMAAISYLIVINSVRPDKASVQYLPFLYIIFIVIGSAPGLITSFVPSLAPLAYGLTGTVNLERYVEAASNAGIELNRIGALGGIGIALQLYLVSRYSIKTWIRPERWWVLLISGLALFLCIRSGFRSALLGYLLISAIASVLALRWKAVTALIFAVVMSFVLAAGNNNLFHLPVAAQRALSVLPGKWDPDAVNSAQESTDFRLTIQRIYLQSYFEPFSLIGHGFTYNPGEAAKYEVPPGRLPTEEYYRGYVVRKQFHLGWISLFDSVGIIGSVTFIWFTLNILRRMLSWIRQNGLPALSMSQRWLIIIYGQTIIPFWTVYGDLSAVMVMLCLIAGLTHVLFPVRARVPGSESRRALAPALPSPQMA
jgi:hypothetical protein